MANETRVRYDFLSGTISDNPLTNTATTLNSPGLAAFPTVTSQQYAAITLDPFSTNPEIVWITAHVFGQNTATIVRGREGSAQRQHVSGTRWSHAPTAFDDNYPKSPVTRIYARSMWR